MLILCVPHYLSLCGVIGRYLTLRYLTLYRCRRRRFQIVAFDVAPTSLLQQLMRAVALARSTYLSLNINGTITVGR